MESKKPEVKYLTPKTYIDLVSSKTGNLIAVAMFAEGFTSLILERTRLSVEQYPDIGYSETREDGGVYSTMSIHTDTFMEFLSKLIIALDLHYQKPAINTDKQESYIKSFNETLREHYRSTGAIYGNPMDVETDMPVIEQAAEIYAKQHCSDAIALLRTVALHLGWFYPENSADELKQKIASQDPELLRRMVGELAGFGKS